MPALDINQAEFLFTCQSLEGAGLKVVGFTGDEALSQPFEFQVELCADSSSLDLAAPIGKPACLTLIGRRSDASRYERHIHGVIEEFVQLAAGIRHSRYLARLVPTLKPLHYSRNSRIFQKESAPDVAKQVLTDGQVPSDWISTLLHATYGTRDYCVQYQESDLNFVQRLWEEEGITYFFEHSAEKDTIVLGDGEHAFDTLPHYGAVSVRDQPHLYEEGFHRFRAGHALVPGATLLRDFKFKQPTLGLEAKAEADAFTERRVYYFPGEYLDPDLGKRLAKIRLEEQQCQRNRHVGEGNVRAMQPGYTFTLAGHRRPDCNQEYLIVAVHHEGSQPQVLGEEAVGVQKAVYQNRIECIPGCVPFRPARRSQAPTIPGVQTATVVGPPGEEIHCDEHGRVKVKFHWDLDHKKDDSSSCWIRVSQPWGGMGQGGMFIPRVGQEVIVQFLEGDPDRPLILGRVYNGENAVPHALPAAKNISTIRSASTPGGAGFNEIKFDDTKDAELFFTHAQKDREDIVLHNHTEKVTKNQSYKVGANQKTSVGGNQTTTVDHVSKLTATDKIHFVCGESSIVMTPTRIEIRSGGGAWIALDKDSQAVDVFGANYVNVHSANEVDIKGPSLVKINCD